MQVPIKIEKFVGLYGLIAWEMENPDDILTTGDYLFLPLDDPYQYDPVKGVLVVKFSCPTHTLSKYMLDKHFTGQFYLKATDVEAGRLLGSVRPFRSRYLQPKMTYKIEVPWSTLTLLMED